MYTKHAKYNFRYQSKAIKLFPLSNHCRPINNARSCSLQGLLEIHQSKSGCRRGRCVSTAKVIGNSVCRSGAKGFRPFLRRCVIHLMVSVCSERTLLVRLDIHLSYPGLNITGCGICSI